ncbi:hypothetical protein KIL84_007126 [Mauremys mutica]|uniref:Ig-like domain-containing protein n=1 Tax=Mauremys mutica TaxID=74926 RepID=A0A9D4AUS4_9SAUR|nr:hypothetical protein KIL84_007126 [Mauremys mutica]
MAVGIVLLLGLGSAAGAFLVSTDPSPVTGLLGSDLLLTCSFPAAPRGAGEGDGQLRVSWHFQGSRVAELDGIPISTRVGAILFSQQQGHAQASLLLPRVTPADQGPYRCSVRYAGQHGEGTVRVQVAALPRVEVPSPVVQRDEDSALVCCVRGFYPQHIAVSWLRDGQELNASFVSAARRGHRDGTFSLVTVYRLTPTERDLGALFSCRARHPLLNQSRQADFRIGFRGEAARSPRPGCPSLRYQPPHGPPRPASTPALFPSVMLRGAVLRAHTPGAAGGRVLVCSWESPVPLPLVLPAPSPPNDPGLGRAGLVHPPSRATQPLPSPPPFPGVQTCVFLFTGDPLTIYTLPSSSAVLGSAALLKCRFNIGGPINLTTLQVHWYFSDQSVAQYDRGKEIFAPGVSISEQELLIGNASLGMENVQVSDEGQYKCVVVYGAERQQSETTLRVFAAPRLSIPWRSARTDTATSFPCHVWGFYPGDVTVTWLRDGRVLTDATGSAPQRNPDGTFNLTLTYTFTPTARDSGSTVSCRVSHAALAQPLQEEFPLAVTGADHTSAAIGATLGILVAGGAAAAIAIYCWRKRREGRGAPYSVSEVLGPARCLLGQEVTLSCAMEGTFPEDTAVTWERIHGKDRTVIGTDGDDGVRVRCSFHHKSRGIREQRESGEIQLWAQPQVSEIQVLPHWEPRDQVPFAVQIQNFYPRGIHQIQWSCDGKSWEKSEPTDYSENLDLTFSATSVWRIPSRELNRLGLRVRVSVQQSPQEPPIEREIRAEDTAPAVSEISKPESVTAGKEITLSCRMTGHFPGALSVAWLRTQSSTTSSPFEEKSKREILVPLENSAEYRIEPGAPHTQDGKSFQQETRLSFTPSVQRDQGAKFICRVGHVTLGTPLERHTGELHVADPPQAPVLREISRPQVLAPGEQVTLSCYISRFYPKKLSVTWYRRGRGESEFRCLDKPDTHEIVTPDPTAAPDRKSYFVMSQLHFTPVLPEDDGAEYRCSVEHETLQEPEGKSTGPLELRGSRLQLVTDPSSRALLGSGTLVKCRFDVGGPVDLSALRVQWYLWEERIAQYDQGRVESQVRGSLSEQELENGNASLWLSSVTVSDMGLYKCVVGYGTEQLQGETTLHVLAAPRLSVPRKAGVLNAATSFPCHVWGFYPGDVTVTWLRDGQVLTDATRSAPQRNPDGTFNLTLTYTFTPTLSDSGIIFSCHVSHAALAQPLREEFPLAVTARPQVSRIQVLPHWEPRDQVPFAVQLQNFYPRGIHRIQWSWDGKSWEKCEPTDYSQNPDLTFSATSVWRIPSRELNRLGLRVRVSVQQSPQEPPVEREIRAEDTAPAVSEISKPESVTAGKEITLSCRMTGHFPGALSVAWLRTQRSTTSARFEEYSKRDILVPLENSAEYRIEPGAPHTQDGKSFQQETRLSFTPSVQRDQGAEFICRVGHVTLEIPLERHTGELHVAEPPQAPVLREISRPQVLTPGEQVTLSCYISRFYPKELSVTWYRRGRGESEFRCLDKPDTHDIVTPDPTAAPDRKSYSVMSQLYFTPMLPEDDGAEYRCSVEHETLQEPEGKSTGPLELRGTSKRGRAAPR